jgi:hypothetical protein
MSHLDLQVPYSMQVEHARWQLSSLLLSWGLQYSQHTVISLREGRKQYDLLAMSGHRLSSALRHTPNPANHCRRGRPQPRLMPAQTTTSRCARQFVSQSVCQSARGGSTYRKDRPVRRPISVGTVPLRALLYILLRGAEKRRERCRKRSRPGRRSGRARSSQIR